uniref:cAMP-dependent protein kinase type II-alpha regulatory subunit n=1 Tax=Tetraodon nigroviridis TaxID=99883 RepID=H3D343_TETNG
DEDDEDLEPRVVNPKTDEQRRRLQEACRDVLLFTTLDQATERMSILDVSRVKQFSDSERIIKQGDKADCFYIVESGEVKIMMRSKVSCSFPLSTSLFQLCAVHLTSLFPGVFSLATGGINVVCVLLRKIIKNNTLKLLGNTKVFILFSPVSCLPGFSVQTNTDQADAAEVETARCSRGQHFGELALVTDKPRAASAYAVGDVKCLVIDAQTFERLLGSCKEIMKSNVTQYEEQLVALFGSSIDL